LFFLIYFYFDLLLLNFLFQILLEASQSNLMDLVDVLEDQNDIYLFFDFLLRILTHITPRVATQQEMPIPYRIFCSTMLEFHVPLSMVFFLTFHLSFEIFFF
jgi:hypothetical protein